MRLDAEIRASCGVLTTEEAGGGGGGVQNKGVIQFLNNTISLSLTIPQNP